MSIEIVNIKKSFGRTQVLNDISLDIPSGQMVALLGPSGSGKPRCCVLLLVWRINPAVIFVSMAPT
jgi:ABC-type sulfate/molybdate transport systems ATPase subunit